MNAARRCCSVFIATLSAVFCMGVSGATEPAPSVGSSASHRKPADAAAVQLRREREFKAMLTGAVLEGVWQMTGQGGLHTRAPLTKPQTDRYSIVAIEKTVAESWIVQARIEFAEKDVTVPIPVRVVWADDTPMITIDDLAIPLIGSYSARVIFHNGFYSGVWYSNAKNYGGILAGRVLKKVGDKQTPTPSKK